MLLIWWYLGLVYIAFLIGVVVSIWTLYDANRKQLVATVPQALALISTILMVPSLILAFLYAVPLIQVPNQAIPMGYLGILGALGAVLAGLAYGLRMGVEERWVAPPPVPTQRTVPAQSAPPRTAPPRSRPADPTQLMRERMPPAAWLVFKTGPRKGQQLGLSRGANTIGRSSKSDLVVEEGTVSGEHARIQFENGQFVIYDLASLNGTFVNGQRTQRQLLMDGDEVRLGQLVLVFKKV